MKNEKTLRNLVNDLDQTRPLEPSTLANYRRAVIQFSNWIGVDACPRDMNELRISEFLRFLEETYSPTTVRNIRRDLLIVWRFASYSGFCDMPRSRMVRLPRAVEPKAVAWPVDWIPRLFAACRTLDDPIREKPVTYAVYAEAYFRTQVDLLCRPSDMRLLRWDQIDGEKITFRQKKTQIRHLGRLAEETLESVDRLRVLRSEKIFPLSKSATERLIGKVFRTAGIAKPTGESLGHLRHTGGTVIATIAGCDAARKALGHTPDSRVFERHYQDRSKENVDVLKWWQNQG